MRREKSKSDLKELYFQWMTGMVMPETAGLYQKLLEELHGRPFAYILPMDENREADGYDLRYQFGYEFGCEGPEIVALLDTRPCSVLEMMVALCLRCEALIGDTKRGSIVPFMFYSMLETLGLDKMTDDVFDAEAADRVIWRFLSRRYSPDGTGGLFALRETPENARSMEIWRQAMLWLDQNV